MNKLRQHWKDNGTPFFFHFEFGGLIIHLDSKVCDSLDNVYINDSNYSALDILVDCQFLDRSLQRISDPVLIQSVKSLIFQTVMPLTNYVSLSPEDKKHLQ